MSLAILGLGNVGRSLYRQAKAVGINVVACADLGDRAVFSRDSSSLDAAVEGKRPGEAFGEAQGCEAVPTSELIARLADLNSGTNPVVVADTSATEHTLPHLLAALDGGLSIALANKKPVTVDQSSFSLLTASRHNARFECVVGAGLPVVNTLWRLGDAGDTVSRVEGQLSGTLGYILSELEGGRKFSEIVAEAKGLGITEPDPRDDLGGLDVARKALILARFTGSTLELGDIAVEPLFPPEMAELSVEEFVRELPVLDEKMAQRVQAAKAAGCKLRYAAVVEPGVGVGSAAKCSVGLVEASTENPLAGLSGTDNLVSFTTACYSGDSSALVVRGPGAGVEVTASGVLSDVLDLVTVRRFPGIHVTTP